MIPSPPPQMTVSALWKRTLQVRLVDRLRSARHSHLIDV